jgi:hypothetical protein
MIPKMICNSAAEKSINNFAVPFESSRCQKIEVQGIGIVIFFKFILGKRTANSNEERMNIFVANFP